MPGILQQLAALTVLERLQLADFWATLLEAGDQPGLDWRNYVVPYATNPAAPAPDAESPDTPVANPPGDGFTGADGPPVPFADSWITAPDLTPSDLPPALPGYWKLPAGASAVWAWTGLPAGTYRVCCHWHTDPYLASGAGYTVATNAATAGPIRVNHRTPPTGVAATAPWGAPVTLAELWRGDAAGSVVLTLAAEAGQDGPPEAGPAWLQRLDGGDPVPTPPPPTPAPTPTTDAEWCLKGTATPAALALARLRGLGLAGAKAELGIDDLACAALVLWGRDHAG